jgi:hypothetical protein
VHRCRSHCSWFCHVGCCTLASATLLCCQHQSTDVCCDCAPADAQQKGFYSRSIRKLESLLDKGSGGGSLALDHDIATRLNAQQQQLLHLNRALLYLMSGAHCCVDA